jgi:hypothetical protein
MQSVSGCDVCASSAFTRVFRRAVARRQCAAHRDGRRPALHCGGIGLAASRHSGLGRHSNARERSVPVHRWLEIGACERPHRRDRSGQAWALWCATRRRLRVVRLRPVSEIRIRRPHVVRRTAKLDIALGESGLRSALASLVGRLGGSGVDEAGEQRGAQDQDNESFHAELSDLFLALLIASATSSTQRPARCADGKSATPQYCCAALSRGIALTYSHAARASNGTTLVDTTGLSNAPARGCDLRAATSLPKLTAITSTPSYALPILKDRPLGS